MADRFYQQYGFNPAIGLPAILTAGLQPRRTQNAQFQSPLATGVPVCIAAFNRVGRKMRSFNVDDLLHERG